MEHSYLRNVYDPLSRSSHNLSIPALAYMDDTNWISDSELNLAAILNLAQSFFRFTHIRVNHFKAELLRSYPNTNARLPPTAFAPITFTLQDQSVTISPKPYNCSVRYLGVWISLSKQKSFAKTQATSEVSTCCRYIKRKWLTDKQLLYVYNMVIVPRLEYRSQLTIFSQSEWDGISASFRTIFKNKLRLSRSAPNALLANHAIYNFRDMFEVQLQAQFSNFIVQLNNSGLLGQITHFRLACLQSKEGLNITPLLAWDKLFPARRYKTSFILNVLDLLHRFNFSVNVHDPFQNKIDGGFIF